MLLSRPYNLTPQKSTAILGIFILFGLSINFSKAAEITDVDFQHNQTYRACMQLTHQNPEDAFETGLSWQDHGGGLPARHCTAIALFEMDQFQEAAKRLQALAQDMPNTVSATIVSEILGQAGLALSLDGELSKALEIQTAALEVFKDNVSVLTDRALTLIDLGRVPDAILDLSAALNLGADNVEAMVYRGAAYRQMEKFEPALNDLDRAIALDPTNPDALLERGIIYRLKGSKDLARVDWLKLIEYHDGRPVADMAQRNLQKMELEN